MPSDKEHKDHARHNLKFLQSFYPLRSFDDWVITVAFYAVLQIVEYVIFVSDKLKYRDSSVKLSHSGDLKKVGREQNLPLPRNVTWENCSHHLARDLIIQYSFQEIYEHYNSLYKASRVARYHRFMWLPFEAPLYIAQYLDPIIRWAEKNWGLALSTVSSKMNREEK